MDPLSLQNTRVDEADRMTKLGAEEDQQENSVNQKEINTIVMCLFRTNQTQDSYYHLSRQEQVIIFLLQTGHNRLNYQMHKRVKMYGQNLNACTHGFRRYRRALFHPCL